MLNGSFPGVDASSPTFISTDANHMYKPDPRAYQLDVDGLHLATQDIVFAAFGGWDAADAKAFDGLLDFVMRK